MRPALMLLVAMGVVIFVLARLRAERPDLMMAEQKPPPDPPSGIAGRVVQLGGSLHESQVLQPVETELQRFQRQREFQQQLYPHLGEAMQLDAKTESALYDLLARQAMDYRGGEEDSPEVQDQVAAEKEAALEKLLGEQTFRRFDEYRRMPATGDVARLNKSLGEANRVRGEAIYRLTVLLHENSIYGGKGPVLSPSFKTLPPETEGSPRSQALIILVRSQDHLRSLEKRRAHIEAEASSFLTQVQLDALNRADAETRESWRLSIEQIRAQLGLATEVTESADGTYLGMICRRIPVAGDIRIELTVTVNGEPVHQKHTGPNRERFGFQASSGLWVDVVPVLYEDGWLETLLAYSETRRGKLRQLDQWGIISSATRHPNGKPSAPHDALTETHRGLMEYKIQPTGIIAAAIEHR